MEQAGCLIDTNSVIDYLANKIPANGMKYMDSIINSVPNISIITRIELLGFNATAEHAQLLTGFVSDSNIMDLTAEVADLCINIRRNHKTKLPDAIIAATAIANGLKLITRNTADFKNIAGLEVLNPFLI